MRQKLGLALLPLYRKSVEILVVTVVVLSVVDGLTDALFLEGASARAARASGWIFDSASGLRLGLSIKYSLRCHVRRGRWHSGDNGMPRTLLQTDALDRADQRQF